MKRLAGLLLTVLLALTTVGYAQSPDVKNWAASLKGQEFFMKIDVVKVQYLFNGTDATNIYPGGKISYRATVGTRQTQSEKAEDFAEEVRIRSAKEDDPPQVRVLNRGSRISIRSVKARDDEVKVEFEEIGGSKHALRLKFEKRGYTLAEAQELFNRGFTTNEADLLGADESIQINGGMSQADVIGKLGQPNIVVNLSGKSVMVYDDLKLIFSNNQLVDVQ